MRLKLGAVCAVVACVASPTAISAAEVTVSNSQLRINQRISQSAVLRAEAIRQRLDRGITSADIRDRTLTAATLAPSVSSVGAEDPGFGDHQPRKLVVPKLSRSGGSVTRTASQLLINQRISQAAVRRAAALEAAFSVGLTGGNIADGSLTEADFPEGTVFTNFEDGPVTPPSLPPRISGGSPGGGGGNVRFTASQLRINQRISQAAIRRLNALRDKLEAGLTAKDFWPGTITRRDLAPQLQVVRPGSTRENPIPFGVAVETTSGWSFQVIDVVPNANAIVAAENMFNDPPKAGRQFFIIRVRATRTASPPRSASLLDLELDALGPSGVSFTGFGDDDNCGVYPGDFPLGDIFPGGFIDGNVCYSVPITDVSQLQLVHSPFDEARTFFALS